jgi:cation transport ATPase
MLGKWQKVKSKVLGGFKKERPSAFANGEDDAFGKSTVTDIFPEMGVASGELLRIGSGLTMESECRDLAAALLSRSTDMLVTPFSFDTVEYVPQQVFRGEDERCKYAFGYADYFHHQGIEIPPSMLAQMKLLYQDDKETFLVEKNGKIIGLIALKTV